MVWLQERGTRSVSCVFAELASCCSSNERISTNYPPAAVPRCLGGEFSERSPPAEGVAHLPHTLVVVFFRSSRWIFPRFYKTPTLRLAPAAAAGMLVDMIDRTESQLVHQMEHWGFELLDPHHAHSPGFGRLLVAMRSIPTRQHYDPEAIHLHLINSDGAPVAATLHQETPGALAPAGGAWGCNRDGSP